jgi:DNA-binding transcriptional LysR family regulator
MDLETLRIFIKVAELQSFTRASEQLGMPKSRVSLAVKGLEEDVGSRLLQRTTRAVRLTPDGEQFLGRARRLTLEADELGSMFQAQRAMRGRVRIDLPTIFAREVLIPKLPEFLAANREIELIVSSTDRRVDVVREGFDCVLRIGTLTEPGLTAKRLGALSMINCASPAYLAKYGTPRSLADLEWHYLVHYSQSLGSEPPSFEYHDGTRYREQPMKSRITVNSADGFHAACLAGLGIIQVPRVGLRAVLAAGVFVDILPEHTCEPMPVSLVHSHGRNVPRRVRAVMNWVEETLVPELG